MIWSECFNYDLFQSLMNVFTIANSEDLILYTISFHLQGTSLFPGPEVIKLFSCSTQLSKKFHLLIKTKIWTKKFLALSLSDIVFILLINVKDQDKFRAQLS